MNSVVPPSGHPLRYLARHGWWVGGGVLCLVGTNLMAQAIPWAVKQTIEGIEHGDGSHIRMLTLVILGLALGQALIRIPSRILIFNAARQAEYRLRAMLFACLCQADRGFYRRFRVGDLMSRLTSDLTSVRALYGPGVLHVANTLFAYAVALPLMTRIDPGLTLWALLPYSLLLLGARSFARGIHNRSQQMQVCLADMTSNVQEDLAGIREVKLHNAESLRAEHFARASGDYLHQAMRLANWRAGLIPFVGLGSGASLVIVLWIGGSKVIAGTLSLGDLVAINLYVGMLAWPTMSIGWILSLWQRGIASWHRLLEIAAADGPLRVDHQAQPTGAAAPPTIELRDLSVSIDQRRVLDRIQLTIPAGTLCAVVGRVGSGKTTLVEAIARLLEVPAATLFIDGADVTTMSVERVRSLMAYAPQTAFLFSATVRDNVAYGLPASITDENQREERIRWAVQIAGLGPDLDRFPGGLDTLVGERGISLSGGQRQRIALARALVADRPVLLLDDSLSSVDADTERQILERLMSSTPGGSSSGALEDRTVILVSHRLSALQHAHQVLVLDRGAVAQIGSHAELLARSDGIYASLYRQQLLLHQLDSGDPV